MYKEELKPARKFVVDHLQKVVFFVSNLKFWSSFCLLLLLIANFVFHADLASPPTQSTSELYYQKQKNTLTNDNVVNCSQSPTINSGLSDARLWPDKTDLAPMNDLSILNITREQNYLLIYKKNTDANSPSPPSTLTVSTLNIKTNAGATSTQIKNNIDNILTSMKNVEEISQSAEFLEEEIPSDSSSKPYSKSRMAVIALTIATFIEHLIPERLLKIIVKLIRK